MIMQTHARLIVTQLIETQPSFLQSAQWRTQSRTKCQGNYEKILNELKVFFVFVNFVTYNWFFKVALANSYPRSPQ